MQRRAFLLAALGATTGCLGRAGGDAPPTTTSTTTPTDGAVRVRVENRAETAATLTVTLDHTATPACRFADPACGRPDATETRFERTYALSPGETRSRDVSLHPGDDALDTYSFAAATPDGSRAAIAGVEPSPPDAADPGDEYAWTATDSVTLVATLQSGRTPDVAAES